MIRLNNTVQDISERMGELEKGAGSMKGTDTPSQVWIFKEKTLDLILFCQRLNIHKIT